MLKLIQRVFNFADWQRNRPTEPPPGDMLDAEFNAIIDVLDKWDSRVKAAITLEGKIAPNTVNVHALEQGLLEEIRHVSALELKPVVDSINASRRLVHQAQLKVEEVKTEAEKYLGEALIAASSITDHQRQLRENLLSATADLETLRVNARDAVNTQVNAANDEARAAALAQDWAVAAEDWAEHMPDTIPPNTLNVMGISGDHWSSRWWANRANEIVSGIQDDVIDVIEDIDEFFSYYLGAHNDAPIADGDGKPLIPGAMYFDLDDSTMYVWTGTQWQPLTGDVGITSAINLGAGQPVYQSEANSVLQFNTLVGTGIITITPGTGVLQLNAPATTWANLPGKPSSFPPTAHFHPQSDIQNLPQDLAQIRADIATKVEEAPIDGLIYGRKDDAWVPVAGPVKIGTEAPAAGENNTFWWDTDSGSLYIRYNDGNSTQWVQVGGAVEGNTGSGGGGGGGGATVIVSDTPPDGAPAKSLWWNSQTGVLSISYDDGDSVQWVATGATGVNDTSKVLKTGDVMTGPLALPADPTLPLHAATKQYVDYKVSARNRLVNGAMLVSQENGDTPSAAAANGGYYAADQWGVSWALTGTITTVRGRASNGGGGDQVSVGVGTATPSPAAGAYWQIYQTIEGQKSRDFLWGTANAKRAILRFSAYSSIAGTFTAMVKNAVPDRSYLVPFTLAAGVWQTFTIIIPGDTTGVWPITNAAGIQIGFGLAAGTTFQGTAGWQAGNKVQIAGNTNLAATAGAAFAIADVGLYLDVDGSGIPPAWEMPDYADDLIECSRYYAVYGGYILCGYNTAGTLIYGYIPWRVPMRVGPSALTFTNVSYNNASALSYNSIGVEGASLKLTITATAQGWGAASVIANARM